MTNLVTQLATQATAASSSSSLSFPPFFILIIVAVILINGVTSASRRKRKAAQADAQYLVSTAQHTPPATPPGHQLPGRPGTGSGGAVRQPVNTPYVGTLLNGVPLRGYDIAQHHQTPGFANERMLAEAELKRQLEALDAARRAGQVDAEQYAHHRDTIFRNF